MPISLKKYLTIAFLFVSTIGGFAQKSIFSLITKKDTINIYQEMLNDHSDDLMENHPAGDIYNNIWRSDRVNPYKIPIDSLRDSVRIDCSHFVVPVPGAVTSVFGPRRYRFHYGTDLRLNVGDSVVSAFSGKVRIIDYEARGYGNYIVIRHDNGLETVYGHLSAVLVGLNQTVKAGELIALGGNTGHSTGPHLHFETRFLGNPINPHEFFDFEKGTALTNKYLLIKETAFDYKHFKKSKSRGEHEAAVEETASTTGRHGRHGKDKSASAKAQFHKVKGGETLSHIADRYNVSIDKLCKLNKISRTTLLKPGKKIKYS